MKESLNVSMESSHTINNLSSALIIMDSKQVHLINNNFIQLFHHLTQDMVQTMHKEVKEQIVEIDLQNTIKNWF